MTIWDSVKLGVALPPYHVGAVRSYVIQNETRPLSSMEDLCYNANIANVFHHNAAPPFENGSGTTCLPAQMQSVPKVASIITLG